MAWSIGRFEADTYRNVIGVMAMREIRVVSVSVQVSGRARQYPYHELRIVECDVGGGHYANSIGCTILRRSGPRRGTVRLRAEYEAEAAMLRAELDARQSQSDYCPLDYAVTGV